jgi:hypothetical protein
MPRIGGRGSGKSAALRAGWNELDCRGPAALAMTGSSDELPSPTCGGGCPKGGRGLPTIRRAAPLFLKKGTKERDRLSAPRRKEISVASLRMERSPLPALRATLPRKRGREVSGRMRHCESRPPRHRESRPHLVIARAAGPWQ